MSHLFELGLEDIAGGEGEETTHPGDEAPAVMSSSSSSSSSMDSSRMSSNSADLGWVSLSFFRKK